MPTGTVKWFNNAKGYGFVIPEAGGEDLFAHYSSIQMEGYRTLKAGQTVDYELKPTDKGFHAVDIQPHATSDEDDSIEDAPANTATAEPAPAAEKAAWTASTELEPH